MGRPLLRWGSQGPDVKILQQALNLAKSVLPRLVADGIFGSKTNSRVLEFQRNEKLAADGVVGPNTHGSLEEFYKAIATIVDHIVPPATEAAARARIKATALNYCSSLGWPPQGPTPPDPASPKIAAMYCDPVTRARQGGVGLASLFQIAGHADAPKCLTLKPEAEDMYFRKGKWANRPPFSASDRNNIDIASWCGIFSLCVLKVSGLKMSLWGRGYRIEGHTKQGETAEMRPIELDQVKEGDIGNIEPFNNGRNHFFVVTGRNGNILSSVDGNAGTVQTIISRTYTITGKNAPLVYNIHAHGSERCVFLTPIWERVL